MFHNLLLLYYVYLAGNLLYEHYSVTADAGQAADALKGV